MAIERETVYYGRLSAADQLYLHPQNWRGHSVCILPEGERVTPHVPPRLKPRSAPKLSFAELALQRAITALREGRTKPHEVEVFDSLSEFTPGDHQDKIIGLDRSVMVTRGPHYKLDPHWIPENPGYDSDPLRSMLPMAGRLETDLSYKPLHVATERLHYLREIVPAVRLGLLRRQNVAMSNLGRCASLGEYEYHLGILALPETIEVGAVQHSAMPDGHEIFTRTHAVYTFPKR